MLRAKQPRVGRQEDGKPSPENKRKIPRAQMWQLCVQQIHQGKQIRTPGCAEMNQSDKTEPKPRTPCSRQHSAVSQGSIGSPWITPELPCSVRNKMDLAGRVPVHLLPEPLLFWGTELHRKDNLVLGLVFFSPRIPLSWDWTCCTGAAKPLMPRHWIHPPPSCYSLPLAFIFQKY